LAKTPALANLQNGSSRSPENACQPHSQSYPKQHQVIVVYLNKKGQKCSSFFSYRLFARWQQEAIAAIASCRNQQILAPLEVIVQYDLEHFKYPVAIADAIWEALLNHISRVTRELRLSKQCA
jgi:hypothetical protein